MSDSSLVPQTPSSPGCKARLAADSRGVTLPGSFSCSGCKKIAEALGLGDPCSGTAKAAEPIAVAVQVAVRSREAAIPTAVA